MQNSKAMMKTITFDNYYKEKLLSIPLFENLPATAA